MRYNLDFKLKIIAYYRQGHTGIATAKKFGLDKKIVSKWIHQYQNGGIDAIKPKASKTKHRLRETTPCKQSASKILQKIALWNRV